MLYTLHIAQCALTTERQSVLQRLKDAGLDRARVPYSIDSEIVSWDEMSDLYLADPLHFHTDDGLVQQKLVRKMVMIQSGPDAGKIRFELGFNLA